MAEEFLIRQESLQTVRAGVQTLCDTLAAATSDSLRMIDLFLDTTTLAGAFVESTKRYMAEVHRAVLRSFAEIGQRIQMEVQSYVAGYADIDEQDGFVLPASVMDRVKDAVVRQQQVFEGCLPEIHAALQNAADLLENTDGSSQLSEFAVRDATQRFCERITGLQDAVSSHEARFTDRLNELQTALDHLQQIIDRFQDGSGSGSELGLLSAITGIQAGNSLAVYAALREQGFDMAAILRMERYGYGPGDLKSLYDACVTDADQEFLLYLTEGDYEKAFAQDPFCLSEVMGIVGADYALRLFAADDQRELEEFNNAVLLQNDGLGWFSDPSPGMKTIRQAYLEKLFQGAMALLELNSSMILQGNTTEQMKERSWDLLNMVNLWNAQCHLEEELTYRRDPQLPVQVHFLEMDPGCHQMTYHYIFTAISHNPFAGRQEVVSIGISSDILETSEDLLNGMYLAERTELQEASEHLLEGVLEEGLWSAGTGIVSVAIPELGLALKMLKTAAEQDASEMDDHLLNLAGKIGLAGKSTENILLGEAIDGLQAYLDKNTELSEKIMQLDNLYEGSVWGTGIRSSYTIPDAFSSGEKTHILSGIYNPDYLETIGNWNREGIVALIPEVDAEQLNCAFQAFQQDAEKTISSTDSLVRQMINGFGAESILDYPIHEIAEAKHILEELVRNTFQDEAFAANWNVEQAF